MSDVVSAAPVTAADTTSTATLNTSLTGTEGQTVSTTGTGEAVAQPFEFNDEVLARLPEDVRPHIQELLDAKRQYGEFQTQLGERKLDQLLGDTDTLNNYRAYMEENGITPAHFDSFMENMAAFKADPEKGLAGLQKYVDDLAIVSGQKLYPDIEELVTSKKITPEVAKELHQARVEKLAYTQSEQQRQALAERQQQEQVVNSFIEWGDKSPLAGNDEALTMVANLVAPWLQANKGKVEQGAYVQQLNTALARVQKLIGGPSQVAAQATQVEDKMKYRQDPAYLRGTPEERRMLDRINGFA